MTGRSVARCRLEIESVIANPTEGLTLSTSSFAALKAAATVCPPHSASSSTTGCGFSTSHPN